MTWSFSKPHSPLWSPAATSSAQHIFFANPTTTEWLFGGYHNLLVMGNGWHLLMTAQACSRRTCQSISLTRARPLRCSSDRAVGHGGCLPLGWEQMRFLIGPFRSFCYVLCGYQFSPWKKETWWAKWCFQRLWYPNLLQVIVFDYTC